MLVSLKDGRQEFWERKVRRQGWITGIELEGKGIKEQLKKLSNQLKKKAATLKRYKNRVKQYRQNKLFQSNKSKFFKEFDGKSHEENIISDKEKS